MERIMQINAGSKFGGVSAMIYNFYKHINRDKFQFDFVAPYKSSFEMYRGEIEEMGGCIIELGVEGKGIDYNQKLYRKVLELCQRNRYQTIHIHSGYSVFNYVVAMAAKKAGVQRIIIHSHNAGNVQKKDIIYAKVLAPQIGRIATECFACSMAAGKFMFTSKMVNSNKFRVINNGIEVSRFVFDSDKRNEIRQKYYLEQNYVIGHVGRFTAQKNHGFLLKVFKSIWKNNPEARLMLVGAGELENNIHLQATELGIEQYIIYTGLVKNVNELYSAMDIFVLPSLFEGLPVVGVEAQASGLKCVFSENVTPEVLLTPYCSRLSLSEDIEVWSKEIMQGSVIDRRKSIDLIQKRGFDIDDVVDYLEQIYSL